MAGALCALPLDAADAQDSAAWSATLYAGPATTNYISQIFDGQFHVQGPMAGLAIDRHLANLGAGFSLLAEAQLTHYFFDPATTTLALGLGIKHRLFSLAPGMPVTLALYLGPSYSANSAWEPNGGGPPWRHPFLNYLSGELNIGLPHWPDWSVSIRTFHRSGMYGVYATSVDEGSMLGIGIRHEF